MFGNIITQWVKPDVNRYKLNTDGCSKGNPGQSGAGSLLRSHTSHFLWAMADWNGEQTNMVADARALMQGDQKCVEDGNVAVDIEVDSLILA